MGCIVGMHTAQYVYNSDGETNKKKNPPHFRPGRHNSMKIGRMVSELSEISLLQCVYNGGTDNRPLVILLASKEPLA